jgi:hypothetical protein
MSRRNPSTVVNIAPNRYKATFTSVPISTNSDGTPRTTRLSVTCESDADLDVSDVKIVKVASDNILWVNNSNIAGIGYGNVISIPEAVIVRIPIKWGDTFAYNPDRMSMMIKHDGVTKTQRVLFTSQYELILPSEGVDGYVDFGYIPLWGDGQYSYTVYRENITDQDTSGVVYTKMTSGYFRKVTPSSSFDI